MRFVADRVYFLVFKHTGLGLNLYGAMPFCQIVVP
jgi:hypothetical protein